MISLKHTIVSVATSKIMKNIVQKYVTSGEKPERQLATLVTL
jgi:hypothetical protein